MENRIVHHDRVPKSLLVINMLMATTYFGWWFIPDHIGNPVLYALLFFGELYHIFMAFAFWITMWPTPKKIYYPENADTTFFPSVDIFIPVAGEPVSVIRKTISAAKYLLYPNKRIFILNDGYVANKQNWQAVEQLAREQGVFCITRKTPGGAKAGNINHALKQTRGEIVVIFDADMKPFPQFLQKTIPYFTDKRLGFVQTPQYYENWPSNDITAGAWEQQDFFFGPIMIGKSASNSAFICGTNVAIRRKALQQVGGMYEKNIAEDFLTSLLMHQKGWKSVYVPEVLSTGLAPEDLLSYYKQQLRWARGSLEVLFGQNPLLKRGLSWQQKLQYLSSALYYFNGVIVLIDILTPVLFLFFGLQPVAASTTAFALFFIPYMFLSLYTLYAISGRNITFRAISFSQSSFFLQLTALRSVLSKHTMGFSVTPKEQQQGNFLYLVFPHIAYILLVIIGTVVGIHREGVNPSIITNLAWAGFNIIVFIPFIRSSYRWRLFSHEGPAIHPS